MIRREIWSIMTHQSKLSGVPKISKIGQTFNVSLGVSFIKCKL